MNIFNEMIVLGAYFSALLISKGEFSESALKVWGWALIVPVLLSLGVTWVCAIPEAAKAVRVLAADFIALFAKRKRKSSEANAVCEGVKMEVSIAARSKKSHSLSVIGCK